MSDVNSFQIGGSHYQQGGSGHWDMIELNECGYLEGCTTKYLLRWKDKNGLEDLKKSKHYIEKLIDLAKTQGRSNRAKPIMDMLHPCEIHRWCEENGVGGKETLVCSQIVHWTHSDDLQLALGHLLQLIQSEELKVEDRGLLSEQSRMEEEHQQDSDIQKHEESTVLPYTTRELV